MLDPQLIFLLLMLALLFLMFSRGRKQQRAQAELLRSLAPGTDVMTTSGMYARIVEVDGDDVVLEATPGVRTRWNRRAVARIVTAPEAAPGIAGAASGSAGGLDLGKDPQGSRASRSDEDRPPA